MIKYLIAIFSLLILNAIAQDHVKCPNNDIQCVYTHIGSAKSVDITKTERKGRGIIESTHIKLTNATGSTYTEFPDIQSMPGFKREKREKSLQSFAEISINNLKAINKQSKNSMFKTLITTCPNLLLSENIKKLNGTKAECVLNENITVTYVPEDIYWCDHHSGCRHGEYPEEMDERLQLVSNGITNYYKCNGSLIEQIASICDTE